MPVTYMSGTMPPRDNLPTKYHTCLVTTELTDQQLIDACKARALLVTIQAVDEIMPETLAGLQGEEDAYNNYIQRHLCRRIGDHLGENDLTEQTRACLSRSYIDPIEVKQTVVVLNRKAIRCQNQGY